MAFSAQVGHTWTGITQGAQGWVQYSHKTWGITWLVYGLARYALNKNWISKMDAGNTAKFALGVISFVKFFEGASAQEKEIEGKRSPVINSQNTRLIIWTNATAVALYACHFFGLAIPLNHGLMMAAALYVFTGMTTPSI